MVQVSSVVALDALVATHGSLASQLRYLEAMGYLYRLMAPGAASPELQVVASRYDNQ